MELKCYVKSSDWGRRGRQSIVATLAENANSDFVVDENTAYAELWMGTHPNGPSYIKSDGILLKDYIDTNRQVLGNDASNRNNFEDLPFLFKILSAGKALAIQAHPDKQRAERLHLEQPDIYKDANHKPEFAIALSPFEALCGFRPINEIKRYIEIVPELRAAIGQDHALNTKCDQDFVKKCFQGILNQEATIVAEQLTRLINRLANLVESERQLLHADLLERLHTDYPGDVGCFGVYFFNYIKLKAGEAINVPANEPHAYIYGDCVECMACSDNVARGGFTLKFKDVPILTEMLNYSFEPASSKRLFATLEDDCTQVFRPLVPDFAVAKITIAADRASYRLIPRTTASILIIIDGKAEIDASKTVAHGSVLFIPANDRINIKVTSPPMLMFQAFANV